MLASFMVQTRAVSDRLQTSNFCSWSEKHSWQMCLLLTVLQWSKNFSYNVGIWMPLSDAFDHYLGDFENQQNRTEVLFHYSMHWVFRQLLLPALSTLICSVWIHWNNLSQKLRISILEVANMLEIMFASVQKFWKTSWEVEIWEFISQPLWWMSPLIFLCMKFWL